MIVFDKELLNNTFLFADAKRLNDQGFISKEHLREIKQQLPMLTSHDNLLVRIGFFILGCLLFSSLTGVIAVFIMGLTGTHFAFITFFYTLLGIVASEFLARRQRQYGYGLDDAFILGFQGFFCATIGVAFESPLATLIAAAFIGLVACIRYVHTLSLLISLIGITGSICYAILKLKIVASSFLPFILLLLAISFYCIFTKITKACKATYYTNSILILKGFSLLLGYFSMNYLVVRELSESLLELTITKGEDIPFAFLFYGFTFLVPVFYMFFSLYSKDKLMLYIGFLTFGFSIFTFRFYYSVLPLEVALLSGGALLFAIAYFAIRKLRHKETGITFEPAKDTKTDLLTNLEAFVIATQVDLKPMESQSNMPFGGGGFSGGGAGESF